MERATKELTPIYKSGLCTDCLMCQITCAQLQGGRSRTSDSHVRVLATHPLFNPVVIVDADCDCPDGGEMCEQVCGPKALRFVAAEELLVAAVDGWQAAPIEE